MAVCDVVTFRAHSPSANSLVVLRVALALGGSGTDSGEARDPHRDSGQHEDADVDVLRRLLLRLRAAGRQQGQRHNWRSAKAVHEQSGVSVRGVRGSQAGSQAGTGWHRLAALKAAPDASIARRAVRAASTLGDAWQRRARRR